MARGVGSGVKRPELFWVSKSRLAGCCVMGRPGIIRSLTVSATRTVTNLNLSVAALYITCNIHVLPRLAMPGRRVRLPTRPHNHKDPFRGPAGPAGPASVRLQGPASVLNLSSMPTTVPYSVPTRGTGGEALSKTTTTPFASQPYSSWCDQGRSRVIRGVIRGDLG